ncbi:hypothetical protein ASPZODRAFT_66117 [Penicilliopsis zonata CBS 506.65]|uniref:Cyclin-D1-binding protein 1-like N-terminal domain-containing protein n=1 Tax=Penicilliopsis zonata CBS 506.65 TaxID=1073090 RepID=A0A1L9SH21_9EURO|nr:hypothetical protein ASPZODRAFT_66117 [Penicilliopsis zonata CBS 506.65]OJJ46364.1 hypothetical protein ASPZODRAFT_66117 [Penicilliopsis zonata CBS 506.65]
MSKNFTVVIATSLALSTQFQAALSSPTTDPAATEYKGKDALPLVSASATALRAQVTKLSLLAMMSPFTPSAIAGILTAVNESVLPSLVTAALLVTPNKYTKAFHTEINTLSKTTLKEFSALVEEVKLIAKQTDEAKREGKDDKDITKPDLTLSTGRVWDACDRLNDLVAKGVVGFVIRRVEEWRDLVRDAMEEIEEWDPEEGDDFFDDLIGEEGKADEDQQNDDDGDDDDDQDTAALLAHKKATLRFLKPVVQMYSVVVVNRLRITGGISLEPSENIAKLESLMANLQSIPDQVDEAAGALYEDNTDGLIRHMKQVKSHAANAVDILVSPWSTKKDARAKSSTEDKFAMWSKAWVKVLREVTRWLDETPDKA